MKKFVMLVLALVLCMNMVAFSAVAETAYNDLPFQDGEDSGRVRPRLLCTITGSGNL